MSYLTKQPNHHKSKILSVILLLMLSFTGSAQATATLSLQVLTSEFADIKSPTLNCKIGSNLFSPKSNDTPFQIPYTSGNSATFSCKAVKPTTLNLKTTAAPIAILKGTVSTANVSGKKWDKITFTSLSTYNLPSCLSPLGATLSNQDSCSCIHASANNKTLTLIIISYDQYYESMNLRGTCLNKEVGTTAE